MIYLIEIPDDSNELKILQGVVADMNAGAVRDALAGGQGEPTPMTPEEYLVGIIMGPLKQKVRAVYRDHVQKMSPEDLKTKLGDIDTIKRARR